MNTISRTRTLMISALLPLIAAPSLSHAADAASDASMQACVEAFVSSSFEKDRRYSVVTSDVGDFDMQASSYRIALTAKGKDSGKQLAKATCVVDRNGVSLTMNGKTYALPAEGATLILSAR